MNVQKLLQALDDESNETLFNFTTDKIREMNLNILKELHLSKKETIDMYNKLNSVGKEKIECCICYNDYSIEDIIITKCCKNLYCDDCILRLKKCGVCNRDF